MYIHLGEDVVIQSSEIIAILEWQPSKQMYEYIKHFQIANKLIDISNNGMKSIVVTDDFLYLSPLSTLTLKRRLLDETETYVPKIDDFIENHM